VKKTSSLPPKDPHHDHQMGVHRCKWEGTYDDELLELIVITLPILGNLMNMYAYVV